jgi:hypothetical protein
MSRPALEVADIFRDHGTTWRAANAGHISLDQLKVMSAIERCRTAALGGHVARCEDCSNTVIAYNSCRNRHCPKSDALALDRQRHSSLNSSAIRSNGACIFIVRHILLRPHRLARASLHDRPIRSIPIHPVKPTIRAGQIPIAPAAPPAHHPPRFPALALFGRRPYRRVATLSSPAAENLHRSTGPDFLHCNKRCARFVVIRSPRQRGRAASVARRGRSRQLLDRQIV